MAYFTFAAQAVGKLQIQIPSTYFRLDTTKGCLADKKSPWRSIQGNVSMSYSQRKRVFREVFNGAAITMIYEPTDLYSG